MTIFTQSVETLFNVPSYGTLRSVALTFNQFDPQIGTLGAVGISLSGTITYHGDFTHCLDCYTAQFSSGLTFNAPGFPITWPNDAPFDVLINYQHPAFYGQTWSYAVPFSYTADTTQVANYLGTGYVPVSLGIVEDSDTCLVYGGCTLTSSVDWVTTLTYFDDPAPVKMPEPATFPIALAALILFYFFTNARNGGRHEH